jgi:hypothetical protein
MGEPEVYATPVLTALSGWLATPGARPQVSRVEVVLELENGYLEWVDRDREPHGWSESGSGNGPNIGWEEPRQRPT